MRLKILKRFILFFLLPITVISVLIYWPKPDLVYFENPKYMDHFHTRIEPTFFDYELLLRIIAFKAPQKSN